MIALGPRAKSTQTEQHLLCSLRLAGNLHSATLDMRRPQASAASLRDMWFLQALCMAGALPYPPLCRTWKPAAAGTETTAGALRCCMPDAISWASFSALIAPRRTHCNTQGTKRWMACFGLQPTP